MIRLTITAVQLLVVSLSFWMAFELRFDFKLPDWAWQALLQGLPWLIVIRGLSFLPLRLFQGLWKYTSIYDLQVLLLGVGVSAALFTAYLFTPWGPAAFPRSVVIIDALVVTMLLGGIRLTRRLAAEFRGLTSHGGARVLIYGAGDAGQMVVREMRQQASLGYQPIGFIDDDPEKIGRRIHGVRVLGSRSDLAKIIDKFEPSEVLLALPAGTPELRREIFGLLEPYKLSVKTLPAMRDIIEGRRGVEQIRALKVEDLLDRVPVGLDNQSVRRLIQERVVLVTGAGGSIGSELCRQILDLQPRRLVLFERYENSLHAIRVELEDGVRSARGRSRTIVTAVVGDVTDEVVVRATLAEYRPEIVFHAAAHKHVPVMEENPCEAVKNNVGGTRIMARAAEDAGVDRFIMISTDKAANPTSVMGASKHVAELVVQAQADGSGTSYATVRFGNVLGSNGSVVPRFLEQIRRGGPVTVTHPEVRRYFMLIPEAVQLVLHAAADAQSGGMYVLDMGEQVKVADMARNLIRLAGKVPDEDIKIEFTGLRPGEKLFEELIGAGEIIRPSSVPKVSVVKPPAAQSAVMDAVQQLEAMAQRHDVDGTLALLRSLAGMVPADREVSSANETADVRAEPVGAPAHFPGTDAQECPKCGQFAHRSRAKRLDQQIRKRLTSQRLFRCSHCGWRGWLEPKDLGGMHTAVASVPLTDLRALDVVAKPVTEVARRGFSPRDLR